MRPLPVLILALLVAPGCRRDGRPHPRLPVSLTPGEVHLHPGERQVFVARRLGQADQGLRWELEEGRGGLLTPAGLFLAGEQPGTFHLRAVDDRSGVSGRVTVVVEPDPSPGPWTAEVLDPGTGKSQSTDRMRTGRIGHGACVLGDGRVLVVGGRETLSGRALGSAELWDPATGRWKTSFAEGLGRIQPSVLPLRDGRALVLGGEPGGRMEVFDPQEDRFLRAGVCPAALGPHQAVRLPGGEILVVGETASGVVDPRTFAYLPVAEGGVPGVVHCALTVLPDGNVLVSGGRDGGRPSATLRLFLAGEARFQMLAPLKVPRADHAGVFLAGDRVLLVGGEAQHPPETPPSCEEVDLKSGETRLGPLLSQEVPLGSCLALRDGRMLVIGALPTEPAGNSDLTLVVPLSGTVRPQLPLRQARAGHSLTLLSDGKVLVVGGFATGEGLRGRRKGGARP